jgi:hypothetical protein
MSENSSINESQEKKKTHNTGTARVAPEFMEAGRIRSARVLRLLGTCPCPEALVVCASLSLPALRLLKSIRLSGFEICTF